MGYSGPVFDHFLYSIRPVSNIDQSFKRYCDLANTIVYYLEHEDERRQIIDNAYELMMAELKFEKSLRKMFAAAQQHITRGAMKT